jgi:hypothetical protein
VGEPAAEDAPGPAFVVRREHPERPAGVPEERGPAHLPSTHVGLGRESGDVAYPADR